MGRAEVFSGISSRSAADLSRAPPCWNHGFYTRILWIPKTVLTKLGFPDRYAFVAWMARLSAPGAGEQAAAGEAKALGRSRTETQHLSRWRLTWAPVRKRSVRGSAISWPCLHRGTTISTASVFSPLTPILSC